ncbi:nucleoside deaminase [Anatilimnocola floriformis]|uniref:nucleoside deaminase n=1 Tax=Anatilimnocola floriformis TaxID=2948575 RepID=UPI0020C375C0|nr:nucleoside deaminase [Anatilimnocola floriformis]
MNPVSATIELPPWLAEVVSKADFHSGQLVGDSDAARMQWAIDLSRRNIAEKTGGPFAALIVEESTGACVAAGVNLVVTSGTSVAHAETVAILLAQRGVGTFDLAGRSPRRYTLYATGQPCIMCFGVIWWSGITKLVCGARGEDVESLTSFREGPLPANWPALLSQRPHVPIEIIRDVERAAACEVLKAYTAGGHPVYNPGSTA